MVIYEGNIQHPVGTTYRNAHQTAGVRAVLALITTCVIVLPILAVVTYVVHRSRPGRFKVSATLLKLVSLSIEVESQQESPCKVPTGADNS